MNLQKQLIGILALIACLMTGSVDAQVVPMTVEDLYASSDKVLRGTVVEQRTSAYKNKIYTVNTVQVTEDFKGDASKSGAVEIVSMGGEIGPVGTVALNLATLDEGEDVVIFVNDPVAQKKDSAFAKTGIEIDPDSPFHTRHMIIGGYQGKFELVDSEKVSMDKKVGKGVKVVKRETTGKSLYGSNPEAEDFLDGLRELKNRFSNKSDLKSKTIHAVGEVETISRQKDMSVIRYFDPINVAAADKMLEKKQEAQQSSEEDSESTK